MPVNPLTAMRIVRDSARPLRTSNLLQPLPSRLRVEREHAARLGLRVVGERKVTLEATEMALAQVLAVDPDRRFLCTIVCGFMDGAPPAWEFASLLESGRGLLLTTAGHPMPLARNELAQSIPDAPPALLLEVHRRGLTLLAGRELCIDEVQHAAQTAAVVHGLLGQPARDDLWGTVRVLRSNLKRRRNEGFGPLGDQLDLPARAAALQRTA